MRYGDYDALVDHPMAQRTTTWYLVACLAWVLAIALMLSAARGEPVGEGCEPRVEACEEGER